MHKLENAKWTDDKGGIKGKSKASWVSDAGGDNSIGSISTWAIFENLEGGVVLQGSLAGTGGRWAEIGIFNSLTEAKRGRAFNAHERNGWEEVEDFGGFECDSYREESAIQLHRGNHFFQVVEVTVWEYVTDGDYKPHTRFHVKSGPSVEKIERIRTQHFHEIEFMERSEAVKFVEKNCF